MDHLSKAEESLNHLLRSENFEETVIDYLIILKSSQNEAQHRAAAASFGGFKRRVRSSARITLTAAFMNQCNITPTQTVAQHLMTQMFGQSVGLADLNQHFAKPGRDASVKLMDAAINAYAEHFDEAKRCKLIYSHFEDTLDKQIDNLKAKHSST